MEKIKEALAVIKAACKGKERFPNTIVEGQLKWIWKEAQKEQKQEDDAVYAQLASVRLDEFAEHLEKNLIELGLAKKKE